MSHKRIKEETFHYHQELEREMYVQALMDNTLQLSEYKNIILTNYWISTQLNPVLNGLLHNQIIALEKDLIDLGLNKPYINNLNLPELKKDIKSDKVILGFNYVVYGSSLGAAVIARRLQKNEQLRSLEHHFYGVQGNYKIDDWRLFCTQLDQENLTDTNEIIDAAIYLFKYYLSVIRKIKELNI